MHAKSPTFRAAKLKGFTVHCYSRTVPVCTVDLLEKGKTTGQAARLLYEPPRREKLELEAAKAKQAEELSKASKKAGAKAADGKATKMGDKAKVSEPAQSPGIHSEEEEEEEEEMVEAPVPSRYWYSLICYGLPNLVVVTQSGKN